jgi:hypothetical protein
MLYKVGRVLQLAGLVILPVAVSGEVSGGLTLKEELILSGIGIAVFFAGWLVQQTAKPR